MPSKTLGQKQFLASTKKVKEKDASAAKDPRQSQRGKDKDAVVSTAKDPEAVPRCSFESPSKRKPPLTRETSPSKATKSTDEPQPEFAGMMASVTPMPAAENSETPPLENTMTTQGSSSITPTNAKTPATKTAPENKVGDSDYDEDEDEDEDEDDVEEDKLPPAKNAAGKAKNPRGLLIKSVTPQGKFKLYLTYTALPLNRPRPNYLGNRALA
jgi:hypothetical protein